MMTYQEWIRRLRAQLPTTGAVRRREIERQIKDVRDAMSAELLSNIPASIELT